jgi:type I restriction enzyme S subunit
LFKSWFVDFEPFKDQPFIESELGMIPQGWEVCDIYHYVKVIYGAPYQSSLFNDKKNGFPLIRIRDLKTYSPQFYTPELLLTTEYVEAGDVVAGMDAEFTPYIWLGEKGVLNQRCCKFKGNNDDISNYFILFLIKPQLEFVQSYKTGTTVSHLGKSDIDKFKFVTPPFDVVRAFSEKVNPMKEEVVNRAKESRRLAELRDALLPRLMSGEIDVSETKI